MVDLMLLTQSVIRHRVFMLMTDLPDRLFRVAPHPKVPPPERNDESAVDRVGVFVCCASGLEFIFGHLSA